MDPKAVRHHQDLRVWKESVALVKDIYVFTSRMPIEEQYGLRAQLRRAAVSIPANIAEGAARGSSRDFARFVSIAQGSLAELESHLFVADELYTLSCGPAINERIVSIRRMLIRLRAVLLAK